MKVNSKIWRTFTKSKFYKQLVADSKNKDSIDYKLTFGIGRIYSN